MKKKLFEELCESVKEAGEMRRKAKTCGMSPHRHRPPTLLEWVVFDMDWCGTCKKHDECHLLLCARMSFINEPVYPDEFYATHNNRLACAAWEESQ